MKGIPTGYTEKWERLRYESLRDGKRRPGESSTIVIAPPRSGKGTDIILPTLLDWEGSVIVVDIKGQNCCVTARHRQTRLKQDVKILSPFPVWPQYIGDLPHTGYNPLCKLDPNSDAFAIQADGIAECVIPDQPGERDAHFQESAQMAFSGTVMVVVAEHPPEKRNLATVFEIITGPNFHDFAKEACSKGNRLVTGRLGRFASRDAEENREISSILSSSTTSCRFMGNSPMLRSLAGPGKGQPPFSWSDLKERPTTVYLNVPWEYLGPLRPWLRLMLSSALSELLSEGKRGHPVLIIMDEFAAYGRLSVIENALALSAGMGVTMLPILQDAGQLKEIYGDRMHSFLAMAGCQMFFAPRDMFTADLISELSGQMEVVSHSRSVSYDPVTGEPHVTDSKGQQSRRLLLPDEVMALGPDEMVMRVDNLPNMILAKRRPYFASREYNGLWAPDPYHPKTNRR